MIGQTISHYKILEKLGEGGMGIVYKAHDSELDRTVALKFLPQYLTSDTSEKERFYHEARAASALNHPNITTIYEIKEFDSAAGGSKQLYLSMEYVEGRTLKRLVESEPPSVKKVLDIAIQVCEGLAAAHEKGIVHRDIKSDNIMLTTKSQVKIMDFGLAKVKGATKITKAGSTLGTAAYMSPEQAQGEDVDNRSDIFSFGVVLYELLTTKLPFRGEHQAALMYSLINEEPQPIARFNENVSPELERVVSKALAKDKDERYQHIDDMLADLRKERKTLEYAKAGYVRSMASMPAMEPVRPKMNYTRYLIAGAAVVVLVIAFVIFNPFNFQVTTQKSAAAEQQSLAVMYFQNIPDPEDKDHTGDMISDLLITSLSQTKGIEVISRERLLDIQKQLQADSKSITPEMATKVAQRAGVTTMLLGSILQKQPSLAVTFRLVDVKSGNILGSQRVTGYSADKIFSLVDTMALLVKNSFRVPDRGTSETKSVAEVTTQSPEAYRSYLEGIELNERFYPKEAEAAFRRAIELDSNFAMAYLKLATVNLSTLTGPEVKNAIVKAYALSGNLPEHERLSIQATYAGGVELDESKSVSIFETIVQKYPHDHDAGFTLARAYGVQGNYEKMNATFVKIAQDDSLDKSSWNSVAYSYAGLGRRQEALSAIDRYLRLAPAEPNSYDSKGDIYAQFGEVDSAMFWWNKAITFRSDFPSSQKLLEYSLIKGDSAGVERYLNKAAAAASMDEQEYRRDVSPYFRMFHGQLTKARAENKERLAEHRSKKAEDRISDHLLLNMMFNYELGDYASMLQDAQDAVEIFRKDSANNPAYGRMLIAISYTKLRNPQAAMKISDGVNKSIGDNVVNRLRYDFAWGIMEFERGNHSAALDRMNKALRSVQPNHAPLYFHALSLLKAGRIQEAIDEFQRNVRYAPIQYTPYDLDRLPMSPYGMIGVVKSHYWLGTAYEQQGNKQQAIEEYDKFLQLWKNADFKSSELADAKVRLSKLRGIAAK
ncbi:MAG TPA: FlgO family outer membrane protein [Bacteroidota bacterium]|nr:FlgO family outer membrane protein [Bacteroidota bacterium]